MSRLWELYNSGQGRWASETKCASCKWLVNGSFFPFVIFSYFPPTSTSNPPCEDLQGRERERTREKERTAWKSSRINWSRDLMRILTISYKFGEANAFSYLTKEGNKKLDKKRGKEKQKRGEWGRRKKVKQKWGRWTLEFSFCYRYMKMLTDSFLQVTYIISLFSIFYFFVLFVFV